MRTKTGPGFYLMLAAIMVATFVIHEAGHWLAAIALGHDAYYGLNGAGARGAIPASHAALISIAGPIVTVLQGMIAFLIARRRPGLPPFAVLWSATFMRLAAAGMSLILLNDEARVSVYLGWPAFVLPTLVAAGLVALTVMIGARLGLSWRAWVFSWLVGSTTMAAIVSLDLALKG
ncbi:MAG: hypothetical protein EON88_32380 [Brevundimonas sp.]|nr:MAG: hypothetical protein EON88_32380 [Brevundimonas sp.]